MAVVDHHSLAVEIVVDRVDTPAGQDEADAVEDETCTPRSKAPVTAVEWKAITPTPAISL